MTQRMIPGLSHQRGTGLTAPQMRALDAERRDLDAAGLAQRVRATTPPAPPAPSTTPERRPGRTEPPRGATQAPSGGSHTPVVPNDALRPVSGVPAPRSSVPAPAPSGPVVVEVAKTLREQADRRARAERLNALDAALTEQRFAAGSRGRRW